MSLDLDTCSTRTGLYGEMVFGAYMRGYIPKLTKTSLCLIRREFILLVNFLVQVLFAHWQKCICMLSANYRNIFLCFVHGRQDLGKNS